MKKILIKMKKHERHYFFEFYLDHPLQLFHVLHGVMQPLVSPAEHLSVELVHHPRQRLDNTTRTTRNYKWMQIMWRGGKKFRGGWGGEWLFLSQGFDQLSKTSESM